MHVKPGKGAAFVRSKLKNVISGNVLDKTFRAGEKVEVAQVEKSVKQFTYMDGDQFVFMDMESYDEIRLSKVSRLLLRVGNRRLSKQAATNSIDFLPPYTVVYIPICIKCVLSLT